MHISNNIRFLRKKAGLTQEGLAKKIGKNAVSVSDYEKGKSSPTYETALQLCGIFGVTLDQLVRDNLEQKKHLQQASVTKNSSPQTNEQTLTRMNQLLENRVRELEREIRESDPALAKKLGIR